MRASAWAVMVVLGSVAVPVEAQPTWRTAEYTSYQEPAGVPAGFPRALGDRYWDGLDEPSLDWPSIDAALLFRKNGFAYLFCGDEYVKFDLDRGEVVAGYPKKTGVDGWLGGPRKGFDAAVQHGTKGFVYFFSGDRYWRFDIARDRFEAEPRRLGVDGWFGVWRDGVDGAVYHQAKDKYYFFKGDEYLRYDAEEEAVDPGYPARTGELGWRDVRGDIAAVVERGADRFDFFHPPTRTPEVVSIFNRPDGRGSSDAEIHDFLERLLDGAVAGSRVWLSVPGWGRRDLAEKVVAAHRRGVEIRIVANGWGSKRWFHVQPGVQAILEQDDINEEIMRFWLGRDPGLEELGFRLINHAKLALFENAGPHGRHISIVSSSNWRTRDRQRQNSAVALIGHRRAYDALEHFARRVYALSASEPATPSDRFVFGRTIEIDRSLEIHLTPSVKGRPAPRDPHLELLRDVRCTPRAGATPSSEIVWVAGSTWKNKGRGRRVVDELVRIKQGGCDVRILGDGLGPDGSLTRDPEKDETGAGVFARAGDAGIPWGKTWTHSKYIIVDAPLQSHGGRRVRALAMGALNLSSPIGPGSMLEVGFSFYDDPVVDDFVENWRWLCTTAAQVGAGDPCAPRISSGE